MAWRAGRWSWAGNSARHQGDNDRMRENGTTGSKSTLLLQSSPKGRDRVWGHGRV